MKHLIVTVMLAVTAYAVGAGCTQPGSTPPPAAATQPPAAQQAAVTASASSLEAKANGVVDRLAKGDFAGIVGMFDTTMKGALPESTLKNTWNQLTQQTGPFRSQGQARVTRELGYDAVYVDCTFEKARLTAKVVFNQTGEISGLFLQSPRPLS